MTEWAYPAYGSDARAPQIIKALPGHDGAFWLLDGPEAHSAAGSGESLVVPEPFQGLPEAFSTWKGSTELGLSPRHQLLWQLVHRVSVSRQ